jgi:hypothetical protein
LICGLFFSRIVFRSAVEVFRLNRVLHRQIWIGIVSSWSSNHPLSLERSQEYRPINPSRSDPCFSRVQGIEVSYSFRLADPIGEKKGALRFQARIETETVWPPASVCPAPVSPLLPIAEKKLLAIKGRSRNLAVTRGSSSSFVAIRPGVQVVYVFSQGPIFFFGEPIPGRSLPSLGISSAGLPPNGPAHLHSSGLLVHAWERPSRVARPQTISALKRSGIARPCQDIRLEFARSNTPGIDHSDQIKGLQRSSISCFAATSCCWNRIS